ncbi:MULTISPECIES: type III pantothenate kinase [Oceanobacillus]|uniref:Type III pantothenate kinase n=1 Tax=Oceanobacillus kimchii TaxID=746691 RepID=A0ABQ5TFJ6_9BACI|nr:MULTISPECIES: type III pantothenate kinase [Oceanobacillus]MBT2599820.1 type III pantothenate kinase [Oceanobacillus sp. ISL-74]MBT2652730.1 type III pantothenate kinase [Oceanobacillus sp. ISL-73]MCT1577273.1 type III pantothenate kinase [Oceanobacillus kimchii]MCT2135343.1 type III pantothenate kinase [Oceanobacillus kimchii]OEH56606.1 type III pantothenate kinase [Oceanobacillus sp. E9]
MLFVLDVGNTNTVLGVFDQGELTHHWRIKTDRYKTEDEFGMLIHSLFQHKELTFEDIKGVIISSVVPPILFALEKMSRDYFHIDAIVIGKTSYQTFLKMNYPNPQEIGADRIVNAVAATEEYGAPLIIIDFGTATTYCYIDEDIAYAGGIITPGINISMEALYSKASKLPKIEIQKPETVIGSTTVDAMTSGVFYGYIGQVDGLVERIKNEKGTNPTVIATGGLAKLIAHESATIDIVEPYLTLKGLHLIYQKNN